MIYLITGSPGTGKTSLAVSMILNNKDGLFRYKDEDGTEIDRPLYFCHIDGLEEVKLKAHKLTEEQIQSAPLHEIIPEGSVLIVDEADYTYPLRPSSRDVPPYVKQLKELRHYGLTLILMTQHPSMLDIYIRNLVGKHWHIERKQLGTKLYEFNRCETTLSRSVLNSGVSEFYKPDKKAFRYYKSASQHINFKKKLHPIFYAVGLALVLIPLFVWKTLPGFYQRFFGGEAVQQVQDTTQIQEGVVHEDIAVGHYSASDISGNARYEDYIPTIATMPETKPIYNGIRQVRQMEYPVGCVATADSCHCYSSQGTRLHNIPRDLCEGYMKDGLPFNPYKDPV